MRMVAAVSPPSGGELAILGLDPATHGPEIRARLGVCPQEDTLDLELNIRENLLVYASYFGIRKAEAASRADELLEFVQLTEKAKAKVVDLSGGMVYIGLREPDSLETIEVHARVDPAAPSQEIVPATPARSLARAAPGLAVPLAWPSDWRARAVIAEVVQGRAHVPSRNRTDAHRPHCALSASQRRYRSADSPLIGVCAADARASRCTDRRPRARRVVGVRLSRMAGQRRHAGCGSARRVAGRRHAVVRIRMARSRHFFRPVRLPADPAGMDSTRAQRQPRRSAPAASVLHLLRDIPAQADPARVSGLLRLPDAADGAGGGAPVPAAAGTAGTAAAPGHGSQCRRRVRLDAERRVLDAAFRVAVLPALSAAVRPARALRSLDAGHRGTLRRVCGEGLRHGHRRRHDARTVAYAARCFRSGHVRGALRRAHAASGATGTGRVLCGTAGAAGHAARFLRFADRQSLLH